MADERNFAEDHFLMLSVYMCSAALSTAVVSQYVDVTVFMFHFISKGLNLACSENILYNYILCMIHFTHFLYRV
jgi:hypothetical protein